MEGLSKVSKISGIAFVLIAMTMIICNMMVVPVGDMFNSLFWVATISFLLIGIINILVKEGIVVSTYISRIFLGSLFVVSGLIKANDTLGFSFKLEEYFAEGALNWTIFEPASIELSILIAGAEIILGLAVLFGGLVRLSSWALMGMILFFAWLTYYTASCNDAQLLGLEHGDCVTDCGCFGDAMKGSVGRSLTPWESFFKDVTLFVFTLIVFLMQKRIKFNSKKDDMIILPGALLFTIVVGGWLFDWWFPTIFTSAIIAVYLLIKMKVANNRKELFTAGAAVIFSFAFALYTYTYLPIRDYRGYAIGNNLIEKKKDGVAQVNNNLMSYKNKTTGDIIEISQNEYMNRWEEIEKDYEFLKSEDVVIVEGRPASIQDFSPYKLYENLSEEERNFDSISTQITEKYPEYYEEFILVEDKIYGYVDTVDKISYSPVYFPDSLYTVIGEVEKKINPANWEIDFTNYLFSLEKVLLVISYDYQKSNKSAWDKISSLVKDAKTKGIPVFCIAPVDFIEAQNIKTTHDLDATFLMADGTELKIVVRSNPGVVYLENATVVSKWDYNRISSVDKLK